MADHRTPEIEAFWAAYVAATGATGSFTAWGFGDDEKPELMTRLGLLVREGPKRATTARLDEFDPEADPVPTPGDHSVILDGSGRPLCIIRTRSVEVRPYGEVDEAFAYDYGEGDRTLAWWREHLYAWYARECQIIGREPSWDMPLQCERFEVVFAPGSIARI